MRKALVLAVGLFCGATIGATPLPITPYLSSADSPWSGGSFSYFYLENFESGSLSAPGVSASAGSVLWPAALTDSVDGDDGFIGGLGQNGHSWYLSTRAVRFNFSEATLGALPTVAGIVWTDVGYTDTVLGFAQVEFEAFDALGVSLGTITSGLLGDGLANGGTAEDRFFGFTNASGISAIEIRMPTSSDWEVDHLQYGREIAKQGAVPEPSTMAFLAIGLGMAAFRFVRQR